MTHNHDAEMLILRLQAEVAAERAARRIAEARLGSLQGLVDADGASAKLRSLREQIDAYLDKHGPSPYDFKSRLL